MNAKKKASELVMIYYNQICDLIVVTDGITRSNRFKVVQPRAKQCALIAVDEMLNSAGFIWGGRDTETGLSARDSFREFWQQVKTEIEKL